MDELDARLLRVHAHAFHLEVQRPAGLEPRVDQVLHHLLLPVDRDRATAGQVAQRDAMAAAREAQLEPLVDKALALQPFANPGRHEEVDRPLLQHAGTHALLHVVAVARLDHDRLDPAPPEQVTEHEARRPGADDPHLRAHQASPSSWRTRCATRNAAFAAGTPQ
jgi:hypothetical protein